MDADIIFSVFICTEKKKFFISSMTLPFDIEYSAHIFELPLKKLKGICYYQINLIHVVYLLIADVCVDH